MATYVRTAARMRQMGIPVLVSCTPVLQREGRLGRSWNPQWKAESRRYAPSESNAFA